MRIEQFYEFLQLNDGLLFKKRDVPRGVCLSGVGLGRIELNYVETSQILFSIRPCLHAKNLCIDGSDQLWL